MENQPPSQSPATQLDSMGRVSEKQYRELGPPYSGSSSGGTIATVVVVLVIVVVLALSAIPLSTGSNGDPRSGEARATLAALADRARVAYQRHPEMKVITMKDLGIDKGELNGSSFRAEDYTCGGTPEHFWAKCRDVYPTEPHDLEHTANLVTGSAQTNR